VTLRAVRPVDLERAPAWMWLLSCGFWTSVCLVVLGLGLHKIDVHKRDMAIGRASSHGRFEICKRFAATPRPTWQECLERGDDPHSNLLAPRTIGFQDPFEGE
jgi:hypothetical protein